VLSRAELFRRGVGSGALLAFGALVAPAGAASIPDGDVAYLRLLIAAELLKADFQTRALASGKLGRSPARTMRRMHADDEAHYAGLAVLMKEAAQPPTTAGDIDFSYPAGSFGSQHAIANRALELATLALGGYLGAVQNVQTPGLRLPLGQIAANEAQHVSVLAQLLGKPPIGRAFAPALPIEAVSSALDAYES
jgi:hypothetical protein